VVLLRAMARIRVQELAESNLCQPGVEMLKKSKKKKRVRAAKPLAVFAGLACMSPSKKCDKQLTHIVRVRHSIVLFFISLLDILLKNLIF
jgi:hypothetical protein